MNQLPNTNWILWIQWSLPILILLGGGLLTLLLSPLFKKSPSIFLFGMSLLAIIGSFYFSWKGWMASSSLNLNMFLFDHAAYSFDMLFLVSALLTVLISKDYIAQEKIPEGEYYTLLLFATAGAMLIAHASDLIVLFLGLEIMSLSAYVLTGMKQGAITSYEASLKYFIMGSIASGFFLYGIAMAYGATGSTSLASLQQISIPPAEPVLVLFATALILIGMSFKIAAAPFHTWAPDVYQGAPTSVTAFMASVIKAAGFAAFIRIAVSLGHVSQIPWSKALWVLSALTMTVGNLVALRQTNIKRMLAYSSIAHAGYALVGITAALQKNAVLTESPLGAVLFYLFAYSLMTIGAFAIVIAVSRRKSNAISSDTEQNNEAEQLNDFSGLAKKQPFLAAAMAVFLFSLTGIPPLIGFAGKFYLFSSAIEAGLYGLVIIGVLNSAISAYYYLGPIVKMYFQGTVSKDNKEDEYTLPPLSYTLLAAVFICLFAVLYLGVMPSDLFLMARESVKELVF